MRILVIRFSAMGDVAMLVPVLNRVLKANPDLEITLLTRSFFKPFFQGIDRLDFHGVDIKLVKAIPGIYGLKRSLDLEGRFDMILDLHGSLRSRILCFLFGLSGKPFYRIDKGRKEKKLAIRKKGKRLVKLRSSFNRYLDVFEKSGLSIAPGYFPDQALENSHLERDLGIRLQAGLKDFMGKKIGDKGKEVWLGWAPFAGFPLKEMPLSLQEYHIRLLIQNIPSLRIFLFAGSHQEESLKPFLDLGRRGQLIFSGSMAESLEEELGIMKNLDLMVSMDSSNMHLASLLGIPTLGIYGPTHPDLGFFPFLQRESGTIGLENLECRPCSIFGNTTCYRGDFACMRNISGKTILDRVRLGIS